MDYLKIFEKYNNEINFINCYEPETEFRWEMGTKAIEAISGTAIDLSKPIEICGIPVTINYDNSEIIKLWKSVIL